MIEPDNFVLDHLRHVCGAVDPLRGERVDRLSDRLERFEERLDLTDA